MDTIFTALLISIIAPSILAFIQNYFRKKEKQLDWKREDDVAEKAREAAKLLLAANERVARNAEITNGKLDVIHTLVNSQMTSAMESELTACIAQEALMMEIIDIKGGKSNQSNHSPKHEEALAELGLKISELKSKLGDRKIATERAEAKGV